MDGKQRDGVKVSESISRVAAWASIWGIRQFQFFASGSVTIWRELRRIKSRPEGPIADAWEAAQGKEISTSGTRAEWREFLDAIEAAPVQIIQTTDAEHGIYLEPVERITGLECSGVIYPTRAKRWQIMEAREACRLGLVSITVPAEGGPVVKRLKKPAEIPPDIK